jgi:hypothetical protein
VRCSEQVKLDKAKKQQVVEDRNHKTEEQTPESPTRTHFSKKKKKLACTTTQQEKKNIFNKPRISFHHSTHRSSNLQRSTHPLLGGMMTLPGAKRLSDHHIRIISQEPEETNTSYKHPI